jgi:hypothetical protein
MALEAAHAKGLVQEIINDGGWEALGLPYPEPPEEEA